MIAVNPALLGELNRSIDTRFVRGFKRITPQYTEIATVIPSTSAQNIYPFIGAMGGLREWIGNRIAGNLKVYDFAIKNRDFEKTMVVRKKDLEDDNYGFYANIAEGLGDAAARHPDQLVATLLEAGFTGIGYDGAAFFSTAHPSPSGGSNLSNKGTTALSVSAYATARQQMMALTDDGGEILNITPNLLIVPPALEETARNILFADPVFVSGVPQNNVWKGSANLMVMKRLTDTNNWYLADTTQVLKGLIMQMRKQPQITALNSLTDDSVFWRNEFVWGVDYRGEAGYGLWQTMFGASV